MKAEYQQEQDRQEKKRQDDIAAREAKSRKAYEVLQPFHTCLHFLFCWHGWLQPFHANLHGESCWFGLVSAPTRAQGRFAHGKIAMMPTSVGTAVSWSTISML